MVIKTLSFQMGLDWYKDFYINQIKNNDNSFYLNKLHSNTTNENFDGKESFMYSEEDDNEEDDFNNLKQWVETTEDDIDDDEDFTRFEQLAEPDDDGSFKCINRECFILKKIISGLNNLNEKLKQNLKAKVIYASTVIPSFLEDQREKRVDYSGEWDLGGFANLDMWGRFAEKGVQQYFALIIITIYIIFIAKILHENFFYVVFKDYYFDEIERRKWLEPILVLGIILVMQYMCPADLRLIHFCFAVHIFVWVIVRWYGFIIYFIRACKFQADVEVFAYSDVVKNKLRIYGITGELIHLASLACYWYFIFLGYAEILSMLDIQYFDSAYAEGRKPLNKNKSAPDDVYKMFCKKRKLDPNENYLDMRKKTYRWRFFGFHNLNRSLSLFNDNFKISPQINYRDRTNLDLFSNYLPNFQIHKTIFDNNPKVSIIPYKIAGASSSSNDPDNVGFSLLTQLNQQRLLDPLGKMSLNNKTPVIWKVIINQNEEVNLAINKYKEQCHSSLKLIRPVNTLFPNGEVRYLNDFHQAGYQPGGIKWCIEQKFNYYAKAPNGWVLQSYYNNLTRDTLLNMPSRYLISLYHSNYISDKRFGIDLIALNKRITYNEFIKRVKIEIFHNNSRPDCLLPEKDVNRIFRYSFQFYGNFHELTELFLDNKMTPEEFIKEVEKILPKIYKQSLHLGEETYKYCFDCLSIKLKAIKPNDDLDDNLLIKSLISYRWTIFEAYYIYQPRYVAFENQIRQCNPLDFSAKQSGQLVMSKSTKWDASKVLPNKFRGAWNAGLKQNVWYSERDLLNHFKADPEAFPTKRKIKDGYLNTYLERGSNTNCKRGLQLTSNGVLSQKKIPLTHCNFSIKARLLADMHSSQISYTIPTESKEEKKWY
jgi:hypothetical protein